MHDDDDELFKKWLETVRPLRKQHPQAEGFGVQKKERNQALIQDLEYDEENLLQKIDCQDWALNLQHIDRHIFSMLRRGLLYQQRVIDLHGYSLYEAQSYIHKLLRTHTYRFPSCWLFIHGQGLHSDDGSASMRYAVIEILCSHPEVMALAQAQIQDGGNGALYALIRAKKRHH